jgi:hypothetical protein
MDPSSSNPTSPLSPFEFHEQLSSPLPSSSPSLHPYSTEYKRETNTPSSHLPEGINILVQPKQYQVVNYNIWPSPGNRSQPFWQLSEIEFSKAFSEPLTIQAFLVYNGTGNCLIITPGDFRQSRFWKDLQMEMCKFWKWDWHTLPFLLCTWIGICQESDYLVFFRMTPIKNTVQQSGCSPGNKFRWRSEHGG